MIIKLIRLAIHLAAILFLHDIGLNIYISAAIVLAIGISSFIEGIEIGKSDKEEPPTYGFGIFNKFSVGYIPILDFIYYRPDNTKLTSWIFTWAEKKGLSVFILFGIYVFKFDKIDERSAN